MYFKVIAKNTIEFECGCVVIRDPDSINVKKISFCRGCWVKFPRGIRNRFCEKESKVYLSPLHYKKMRQRR